MQAERIIKHISENFHGVVPKASWGETSLFYNPGNLLANGVYFCTIKEKDGENDKSSGLDRAGIFRLSIGISPNSYQRLFGPKPPRPAKGGIINSGHDFTACNELMPHPVYGWMNWVQILNPSAAMFADVLPLISEAHARAVVKFNQKRSHQPAAAPCR